MTASDAVEPVRPGSDTAPATVADAPDHWPSRPAPRLGRGIVWSVILAEIERDNQVRQVRLRDAA